MPRAVAPYAEALLTLLRAGTEGSEEGEGGVRVLQDQLRSMSRCERRRLSRRTVPHKRADQAHQPRAEQERSNAHCKEAFGRRNQHWPWRIIR